MVANDNRVNSLDLGGEYHTGTNKFQKVSESSKKVPNHLGGEYHTHITQIDIDCPQICPAQRRTLFKVFKFSRINNSN